MTEQLLTLSGIALGRQIREGKVSATHVIQAHIRQMQAVNPALNAVVEPLFEQALASAAAIDAGNGPDSPFAGVPCTIKESFAVAGCRRTAGLTHLANEIMDEDAETVKRYRAAGLIPLATSNVPELLLWMESNNRLYGRTGNAYDGRRIAGGSSGGEGALVGAGATPIGLGSDIGGSIRMPAFFNGVFGHKPSGGLISGGGHLPEVVGDIVNMNVYGPLTRRAEDLMPLLRLLADDPDRLGDEQAVAIGGQRFVSIRSDGKHRISRDLQQAQIRCEQALRALGAEVEVRELPELKQAYKMWAARVFAYRDMLLELLYGEKDDTPLRAWLGFLAGRKIHTLPALLTQILGRQPRESSRYLDLLEQLREKLLSLLGTDGLLLYPSYTAPAPRHRMPLLRPYNWIYTGVVNALEWPATQVPLGLNAKGLPLGMQVVGQPRQDHRTIATALKLEESFGGWQPPWQVKQGQT